MIKAIIFDFDGVILESADIKTEAFRELFSDYPHKIGEITKYHLQNEGISRFVKFRYIHGHILGKKLSKKKELDLGRRFSRIVVRRVLKAPFVAGAREFLDKNRNRCRFFIASGTPKDELCDIIERRGIGDCFEEVHGSPEKKADVIKGIMKRHDFLKDEVVYVGDAKSDRIAAEKARVTFVERRASSNLNSILEKLLTRFKVLLVYANTMMENLIPVNMSILSAVLKQNGFDVKLFDTTYYKTEPKSTGEIRVENLQLRSFNLSKYGIRYKKTNMYDDFRRTVLRYRPDIIGLSAVEDTYRMGISLLRRVEDIDIPVIVGGVHAVISPDEVMAEDAVDMVCAGEGERPFVELCGKMHRGEDYTNVAGIWVKKNGKIIRNSPDSLTDINKLPPLDFTIYEKERLYRPMQGKIYRMMPVEICRGCPFQCSYCAAPALREIYKPHGMYYRKKKIERVIEEIKFYKNRYDLNYVYFTSETFLSLNDEEFDRFVSLYKKIRLPFWCQTRPETIKETRIKILEEINCDRITVGIESGNERIRREVLNRQTSNESIIKAFDILGRSSIPISVNNIIGIPEETREEVFDTINLNRAVKTDSISVFIFTPYRGTRLRVYCLEKGYISPQTYSAGHSKKSILNMPSMACEEITGLLRTFPLYVKFPKRDYDLIRIAERFDEEGNKVFKQLSDKYRKEHFQ